MSTMHVAEALLTLSFLLGGAAALLQLQPRAAQISARAGRENSPVYGIGMGALFDVVRT